MEDEGKKDCAESPIDSQQNKSPTEGSAGYGRGRQKRAGRIPNQFAAEKGRGNLRRSNESIQMSHLGCFDTVDPNIKKIYPQNHSCKKSRRVDLMHASVSDDDEIDYFVKPEFYDPNLDDKDELWVQKRRKGQYSDAVLTCPACFTTLSLKCQRHEKYVTQYRAVFVFNCKIKPDEGFLPRKIDEGSNVRSLKRRRGKSGRNLGDEKAGSVGGETFKPICCSVCSVEVRVINEEEVYHFFNVLPSEC